MAEFPGSYQDPSNIPLMPSPLPGLHEHEAAAFQFSTRGRNNLANASSVFPKSVPLHVLQKMTNGFSKDRELGRGAYGKVYKGDRNGETIAVKLLHPMPELDNERFEKEFYNLASIKHKNIVRLVAFCHDTQRECVQHNGKMIFADVTHKALCFEYMHNGSLDNYLFDECTGLDWPMRYAIIKGICEGLKYLHEELNPPILHLDLKPANILLDDKMMPKLSDFGLSRLFGQERTLTTQSRIGTIGYLPPEYIQNNLISNKFDIFSLGVIIIKIISGRKGYTQYAEMTSNNFIELVHGKWKNRLQETSLDALETYSEQVMECIEMALSCVENDRKKRPSIGDIIDKLNKMETKDQSSSIDQCGGGGLRGSPCGACKFLQRKCSAECVFAPYFSHEQGAAHFAGVHKVFGASNVSNLLAHVPLADRPEAAVTICYEAQARLRDPIYGCVAHIFALQQQVTMLQALLAQARQGQAVQDDAEGGYMGSAAEQPGYDYPWCNGNGSAGAAGAPAPQPSAYGSNNAAL